MKKEWFKEWFDSPYYHLLYNTRDEQEARFAIDNLLLALELTPGSKVLDLACGKGRHARYLAEKGFEVTGLDISQASISYARKFEQEGLEFYQHDMRKPFRINYFDAVMNMFTSFGYFENDADHLQTLQNVSKELKPGGKFLLDFFNARYIRDKLVASESKTIGNFVFVIKRWITGGYVFKNIEFEAEGRLYHFQEKVRLFTLEELEQLLETAGLHIKQSYGGYELSKFEPEFSKRLIIIAVKA